MKRDYVILTTAGDIPTIAPDPSPMTQAGDAVLILLRLTEAEAAEHITPPTRVLVSAPYDGLNSTANDRQAALEADPDALALYRAVYPQAEVVEGEAVQRGFWFGDMA